MSKYAEAALVRSMSWLADAQAAIAHNLANVDTANFKRRASFALAGPSDFETLLKSRLPTIAYGEQTDFRPGISRETGNRFDAAIDGPFFFKVQSASGRSFYTRNGQMQLDVEGMLVTRDGMRYLDRFGQPIRLGIGDEAPSDVAISPNGTISDPKSGRTWGPLAVVDLPHPHALVPAGQGLFTDPTNQGGAFAASGVRQAYLEGSNVDSLSEMVRMISIERSFTATQRALGGVGRMHQNLIQNFAR